ncbi:MAG: MMPL family transporter [Candidatus Rokubacteria bacterium]|nr:MMPL family transporter [Candidatus Rokubacteria bacterium]
MTVSRTGRALRRLVRVACRRPSLTVALALALAVASLVLAVAELSFMTSTLGLLPKDQPYVERFKEYDREFGEMDDLVIAVEAPSIAEAKVYATRLVRELRARDIPLGRIAYRIDPKQFEGKALLYLSKERLAQIRDKIFDYQELLESFAGRPTLDQLVEGVGTQLAASFVTHMFDIGLADSKGTTDLRFIRDLATQVADRIDRPVPYRSPWGGLFAVDSGADESQSGYFLSDDERLLFVLVEPRSEAGSFTGDRQTIEGIRAVVTSLGGEFADVQVGVTGKAALSNDEMTAAFRDSERATLLAFALTLGLLLLAFLRAGKPVLMLLVLALSLCWSIGVTTLVIGHLSLFSVMFISIVIGIGIDYGIYYLFRYEEERFLGRSLREAIEITAARSGPGMLLGAVTAGGTFYVLMLTDFRGIQELGFIAGTAILLAWVAMMTVFPAALVLLDRRNAEGSPSIPRALALERVHVPVVERLAHSPRTVLALAVVLTLVAGWGLRSVEFDYNLLNLQAEGTESVVWEKRILATAGRSGFSALATANSLDELRRKHDAFSRLPSVSAVDSALMVIPDDQDEKRKIIADFAPIIRPVRVGRRLPVDIDRLIAAWETLKRRLDIAAGEAPPGDAQRELHTASREAGRVIVKLRQTDRQVSEPALTHLQAQLYRDFVRSFQRLQANAHPGPVGLDQLPAEIRTKFVSDRGRFLLQIHPAVDIWGREGATTFVSALRSVDPDVTGTPVITYEAIRLMERAYRQGVVYAVILVTIVTALVIRRLRETLLALLPLGLGMLWTMGLMDFFELKFTLGNVFGLPLVLGTAAEYGLNMTLRFMEDREHGGPLVARSTVMAVLVNGLTTIVGFGSLMLAQHRGIFGLGLLLTLGAAASLLAALVVLPVLLRLVAGRRTIESGAPKWPPTPPALGRGPGHPGRASGSRSA